MYFGLNIILLYGELVWHKLQLNEFNNLRQVEVLNDKDFVYLSYVTFQCFCFVENL